MEKGVTSLGDVNQQETQSIDVVEQYYYTALNSRYNEAFHNWRREAQTDYTYRYACNTREKVFIDGAGFLHSAPGETAHRSLGKIGQMLGLVLLALLVCEVGGETALTNVLRTFFHLDIQLSFVTMDMYGSQWAIVLVKIAVSLLKYVLAIWILKRACRIPMTVCAPFRFGDTAEWLGGASIALLCGLMISVMTTDIEGSYFSISQQMLYSYKDANAVLAYALFDLFVLSALNELLYRGLLLQVLRQFGDGFSIVIVAVVACLMPNDASYRLGELLIGLVSGYFMIHSGSLLTCYILRLAYAVSLLMYLLLDSTTTTGYTFQQSGTILLVLALLGLCLYLWNSKRRKRGLALQNHCAELSLGEKLNALLVNTTMLPWLCVAVILTLVQTML